MIALPSRDDQLLLRAALGEAPVAERAWEQWVRRVDFDALGAASMQLIPLVAWNLDRLGVKHPLIARMRGIRRYWWSRTQLLLRSLGEVLDLLGSESVDVLLLGGVPLALGYYADPGLRPLSDFAVLVPPRDAQRAVAALGRAGWRFDGPQLPWGVRGRADRARLATSDRASRDGDVCDLRWHALPGRCTDEIDRELWRHARPFEVLGRATRAPDSTDLLLHACAQGAASRRARSLDWIADAVTVLRHAGSRIDWERLLVECRQRRLAQVLQRGLGQVEPYADTRAPGAARARLERASRLERLLALARFMRRAGSISRMPGRLRRAASHVAPAWSKRLVRRWVWGT